MFLLSNFVTGPSFMLLSFIVLELWEFSFIRDSPEIQKSEIPTSEFCPISGDWGELGVPKCDACDASVSNETLLNAAKCQGYRFYHFWAFKRKPTGSGGLKLPPRLGLIGLANKLYDVGKVLISMYAICY